MLELKIGGMYKTLTPAIAKLRNFCEILGVKVKKAGHSQRLYRKYLLTLHIKNINYQH